MNYMDLGLYYRIQFGLKHHAKYPYSIDEQEKMYPFERDLHYDFIEEQLAKAQDNGGQA